MKEYTRIVTATAAAKIRRRRITVAITNRQLLKKKVLNSIPISKNRSEHGFSFASLPKLILENIRFHEYEYNMSRYVMYFSDVRY